MISKIKNTISIFMPKSQKGQLSITNVIGFFMIIIIVAVLMSPIIDMIGTAKDGLNGSSPITSTLLDLIPLFLVLAVIMTLFAYSRTHYAE